MASQFGAQAVLMDELQIAYVFTGCIIEYLPPYSLDYQSIEQAFSVIKSHLHRRGLSFFAAEAAYYELYLSCEEIIKEMTWVFFHHSGYI